MQPTLPDDLPAKRRSLFGCLSTILIAGLTLAFMSPFLLGALGVRARPIGEFQIQSLDTPVPPLQSKETPSSITVAASYWPADETTIPPEHIFAGEFWRGYTADGTLAYYAAYDEAAFNEAAQYWLRGFLADEQERMKNVWFDLLSGGVEVQMDFLINGQWQHIGAIYRVDGTARQVTFEGFDIGGKLIYTAPDSFLSISDEGVEAQVNSMLDEFRVVEPDGTQMAIAGWYVDDDRAEILLMPAQ